MTESTPIISVSNVSKSFRGGRALNDVSFEVRKGELFALLGPNGAGKTTLIRSMLDLLRPDSGTIHVFGKPLTDADRLRIGYLPEERGLYARRPIMAVLEYFGTLRGLSAQQSRERAVRWLTRLDMLAVKDKKVGELSKGNQQKIQLISTLIADPEIAILDEPFSGLDPVSVRLISSVIRELNEQGMTILLSSHQMTLVEELCNRMVMINKGQRVLYGTVDEVRRAHSEDAYLVGARADLSTHPGVQRAVQEDGVWRVSLRDGVRSNDFLSSLIQSGVEVESFQHAVVPLEDIFVRTVQESRGSAAA